MSVFDAYDGGDFCAGLLFGQNGANMLAQIATAAFEFSAGPKAQQYQESNTNSTKKLPDRSKAYNRGSF